MIKHFKKPFIGAIIGDAHTGKSNLGYHLIEQLQKNYKFNLFVYGFKYDFQGATRINSIDELEKIKDSVIILDEFADLFDLRDRNKKVQIERTLRLLFHRNNIIILMGLPENFKKFIAAKVNKFFYQQVTFDDFINGSKAKKTILKYSGEERGSSILNLGKNECIVFDGKHYRKHNIPYLESKDSKRENVDIFVEKTNIKT